MNDTKNEAETPITAYRNYYNVIAPLIMGSGVGDGKTTACVMAQAATIDALRRGETLDRPTDEMKCACPVLRRMAIRSNDTNWWKSDDERTEHLRPLIPLLLDSRVSNGLTRRRIFRTIDGVVRELTQMRLEYIAKHSKSDKVKAENAKGAAALRALPEIVDVETCEAARDVVRELRESASASAYAAASAAADAGAYAYAYADADADADAYADAGAYAYADADADAGADASTDASTDAGAYAYADADADADADAQRVKYRTAYLNLFRAVASIK